MRPIAINRTYGNHYRIIKILTFSVTAYGVFILNYLFYSIYHYSVKWWKLLSICRSSYNLLKYLWWRFFSEKRKRLKAAVFAKNLHHRCLAGRVLHTRLLQASKNSWSPHGTKKIIWYISTKPSKELNIKDYLWNHCLYYYQYHCLMDLKDTDAKEIISLFHFYGGGGRGGMGAGLLLFLRNHFLQISLLWSMFRLKWF